MLPRASICPYMQADWLWIYRSADRNWLNMEITMCLGIVISWFSQLAGYFSSCDSWPIRRGDCQLPLARLPAVCGSCQPAASTGGGAWQRPTVSLPACELPAASWLDRVVPDPIDPILRRSWQPSIRSIRFYMILCDFAWFYVSLHDFTWFYMILDDFYMILHDFMWFCMISCVFCMILYDFIGL